MPSKTSWCVSCVRAAEQRAAILPARAGESLDDLDGDVRLQAAGREVVEEEERLRALDEDVVDAVIDEVPADGPVDAAHERDAQFGAHAVGARDQHRVAQASLAEVEEPAERAELRQHPGGERRPRQPLDAPDDFVPRVDVDAGLLIVHDYKLSHKSPVEVASERSERATRPERAGAAASEGACRGVRGAKPLG